MQPPACTIRTLFVYDGGYQQGVHRSPYGDLQKILVDTLNKGFAVVAFLTLKDVGKHQRPLRVKLN